MSLPDKSNPVTVISVIIPFHQNVDLLKSSVASVCGQIMINRLITFEIVIGNDSNYSADELAGFLAESVTPIHKLIVVDNKYMRGPGGNRNSALEASSGSYIAFLDADDIWEPKKIFSQLDYVCKGFNFICTGYSYIEDSTKILPPLYLQGYKSIFYSLRPIGTSTVLVSKSLLPNSSPFSNIWFCQDLVLWSTLLKNSNCRYGAVNEVLCKYSRFEGRTSRASVYRLLQSFYCAAIISGLNSFEALVATCLYLVRGVYNKFVRPLCAKSFGFHSSS